MKKLIGQLILSPLLSVLILKVFFGDWWDSVGMRPRWSVWILLSAGLLLFSHYAWTAFGRQHPPKPTSPSKPSQKAKASTASRRRPARVAATPLRRAEVLSFEQEQHLIEAAQRILDGDSFRVELYRDKDKLIINEMRLSREKR